MIQNLQNKKNVRNLLAASFAHNKTNVTGTTLASYLTRNNSRFIFSHKTVWIPLRDMSAVLKRNAINTSIKLNYKTPFFECMALNYICRPVKFKHLCAFDFFEKCEVVKTTSRNKDNLDFFINMILNTHLTKKGIRHTLKVYKREH